MPGATRSLALSFCLAPVLFGFFVPFAFLAWQVIQRGLLTGFDPDLLRHTFTTVWLAATATAIAIALGLAAAIAARMARDKLAGSCLTIAGLGYAIPGTVLALGLLAPLVGIDNGLNALSALLRGPHLGLVVAGSSAALIIAYVIRFLAIATGSAQAGLARVAPEIDDVARTLGTQAFRHRLAHSAAADAAGARRRRLARLRRLPEGIAGDAAVASAQCRDAVDLYLPVRDARHRSRKARSPRC